MRLPATALFALAALTMPAIAADAVIEEAGIAFDLPVAWRAKVERTRIPTGQLMQRWVRDELETIGGRASPGMVAIATPVPDDANLALLTQTVMARKPFNVKLGSETRCIKCKKYRIELSGSSAVAEAPGWPPACRESGGQP